MGKGDTGSIGTWSPSILLGKGPSILRKERGGKKRGAKFPLGGSVTQRSEIMKEKEAATHLS